MYQGDKIIKHCMREIELLCQEEFYTLNMYHHIISYLNYIFNNVVDAIHIY